MEGVIGAQQDGKEGIVLVGKGFFNPLEISEVFVETGYKKANLPIIKLLILGILGGAFIAFAAEGSNVAIHGLFTGFGTAKLDPWH